MISLTYERNFVPIDIDTRFHCCLRRKESYWSIKKICSFYHVNRISFWRWFKRFDGTKESLFDKSHKPLSDHPKKFDKEIVNRVINLHKRSPDQSFIEIWARLIHDSVKISPSSILRIFKRNNKFKPYKPAKKIHNKIYHTPEMVHEKWQIDVKFVPRECKAKNLEGRYYQYTILDECCRKRVLYFTNEHTMYETVKALKYAVTVFGCYPKEIQSDNGFEFTDAIRRKPNSINARKYDNYLEKYLKDKKISHHLIRPRTPQHNGKVERSHRIDQDKFYRNMHFYSLSDLQKQGLERNKRYNNTPKIVFGFKTPSEYELEKLKKLLNNTGEIRCPKRFTSSES